METYRSFLDWESKENALLINSHFSSEERTFFHKIYKISNGFSGTLWLSSSGTTATNFLERKLIVLSKKSFLASAQSVNQHLNVTANDSWLNSLPLFHVGGLAVHARASLSQSKVHDISEMKWNANLLIGNIEKYKVTLTSLVPTQVFDLVKEEVVAPPSLRAVIVGGASLNPQLYLQARRLGWPLLPSYGLSECCSQVATASLESLEKEEFPDYRILKHLSVRVGTQGDLSFSGKSLLEGYAVWEGDKAQFYDPKKQGWFESQDRGELIENRALRILGRKDNWIKVGGEGVNIDQLKMKLQILLGESECESFALCPVPDPRRGYSIQLFFEGVLSEKRQIACEQFNQQVLPIERIERVHYLPQLPRTELGKIKEQELSHSLTINTF